MFVVVFLITVGLIAFLAYRERVNQRLTPKEMQRVFLHIAKLISLEEWQEAKKELQPYLSKEVVSVDAKLLQLQILRGLKEHEKALKLVKLETEDLLFRVEEAKILLEMGRFVEALRSFQMAEPILRKESDFHDLAFAYLKAGFPDQAWSILQPLLSKTPRGNTLALAADIFLEKREYGKAISTYKEAIGKGWNTHQVQTHLGHAYRLSGKFNEAEKVYRKILEKDSSDVAATIGLGACMEEKGAYQKALLLYQACNAWEKKDPRLLVKAAGCAMTVQKYDEAEEFYAEVIKTQGVTPDLLAAYGFSLEKQGKWSQAEDVYKELIIQFLDDPRGYRSLAWMFGVGLTSTLSAKEGLCVAAKSLELSPEIASYEILSAAQARAGLFEEAHQIQEYLSSLDKEKTEKIRRSNLIKMIRKQLPLRAEHITR